MSAACVPLPTPGAPKRTSRHAVPTCSGGAEHLAGGPSSQAARLFSPFAFNGHLQFSSRAAPVTKCFHQVAFKCAISTPPLYDRGNDARCDPNHSGGDSLESFKPDCLSGCTAARHILCVGDLAVSPFPSSDGGGSRANARPACPARISLRLKIDLRDAKQNLSPKSYSGH
jgi:hypothetical protein